MKAWKTAAAVVMAILMSGTAMAGWDVMFADANGGAEDQRSKRAERESDLYQDGIDAIDEEEWDEAVRLFSKCAEMKGSRADGALYWTAYALNKAGSRDQALQIIDALNKKYPKSQWIDDANGAGD